MGAFLLAASPNALSLPFTNTGHINCAVTPAGTSWAESIAAGCDESTKELASTTTSGELLTLLDGLGLFNAPTFPVETLSSSKPQIISDAYGYISGMEVDPSTETSLRVSPLQMAMAAASFSNGGTLRSPRLSMEVENPQGGWVMLPVSGQIHQAYQPADAAKVSFLMASQDLPIWQAVSGTIAINQDQGTMVGSSGYTWYIGGTLPDWKGASLAIVILLEQNDPQKVLEIGHALFQNALYP